MLFFDSYKCAWREFAHDCFLLVYTGLQKYNLFSVVLHRSAEI